MQLFFQPFTVHKRFALTISRGTLTENTNLWLKIQEEGLEGWGEIAPFSIKAEQCPSLETAIAELENLIPDLERFHGLERQKIADFLEKQRVSSYIRAGIDVALWDWLGKKAHLPLWQLWGLDRERIPPISVTIGISSPEKALKRLEEWLKVIDAQIIKIKLGNPVGIEADKAMFEAIHQVVPQKILTVDANGGWNLADAIKMAQYLENKGVTYIEQPLAVGEEDKLKELSSQTSLPLFVDESCFTRQDIPRLADKVQGINIKLMKTGGLSEVLSMIEVARAYDLKIMFGCYSDSSISNTAMLHLAPLADYLDLDSHLNLLDDPFEGYILEQGRLLPNKDSGLGVRLIS